MLEIRARLWKNWQMAFPYELAKRLGIEPGEEVEFVDHNGNIIVKRVECE